MSEHFLEEPFVWGDVRPMPVDMDTVKFLRQIKASAVTGIQFSHRVVGETGNHIYMVAHCQPLLREVVNTGRWRPYFWREVM